ncbi:glycoside hydrolase family 2 TIM barrel-domain containing protein [uncultured Draconibacterium sp.]|uniref:glycoside hydrolase family 2 TIM barrel-domain containing protein n=1 Tax=uncultured Draconibacterium sp. TaxID=1573823 RepID=UPI0025D9B6FB|nr:glycoside hydrolase family 2 TIM barrel-domain containing protein [uncultured Draconibacterium sp.]
MRLTITFILALVIFACSNPTEQNPERKQNFDNNWKFFLGENTEASKPEFDDASWRMLDLPHDWSIEGEFDPSNPAGNDGAYLPTGIAWYRKQFTVPASWNDKKVSIYFEGVYMNSEVFINGHSLGVYPYGYSSFYYDLTPHLNIGGENTIAVRVDNSQQKNCRWYSGSGIYRHVSMIVTDPIHIAQWGVSITTPTVSKQEATVEIKTTLKNETSSPQEITLSTQIANKEQHTAGGSEIKVELLPNSEKEILQNIVVENPALWTPETPNLYNATISIKNGEQTIDKTDNTFGIRSIEFSAENGFLLNGEKVLLNGGCVHHDNGCLGAAAFDRAEERKVELLKEAGFNAVRTSHNIPSEAFLDACDRLGLLVIDEAFDGWREMKSAFTALEHDYSTLFDEWWKTDVQVMVKRDKNHPSIIMWSIGNEIIERTKPEAVETARKLAAAVKEIDTTRPVTSAMTTWGQGWEIFDPLMAEHDVCGYNYQLHEAKADHERVPSRIIYQSESYPKDAFFCWDLVEENPYIIGDFVWTAIDYLGESGIGRWYYEGDVEGEHWHQDLYPWHAAYCGDIDLNGWRKPISHYRSMLYNDTEKLYMAVHEPEKEGSKIITTMWGTWPTWESWTWPGHEGKAIEVEIYSKYEKVRLYCNDKLIGEKATGRQEEFKALFTLPYETGTIKAVGVSGDQEMESTVLTTAEKASKIKLTADRTEIDADGQDLSFITVEMTDAKGQLDPNAANQLHFAIEGPGSIIAVSNSDIRDTDPYVGTSRKAFKGRAMVVVRSSDQAGMITLKASSDGLGDSSINIQSIK